MAKTDREITVLSQVLCALLLVSHSGFQFFLVDHPLHPYSWIAAACPVIILLCAGFTGRMRLS